ncbi:hypothetical protein Tco_0810750 [Tanacetum coccineum]
MMFDDNTSGLTPQLQNTFVHNSTELRIQDYDNELSSSKLVPNVAPPADKTDTSLQELELLFSPMFEEYFNGGNQALIASKAKPKNIKEAMADHAWIESIQEELHQFDRLRRNKRKENCSDSGLPVLADSVPKRNGLYNRIELADQQKKGVWLEVGGGIVRARVVSSVVIWLESVLGNFLGGFWMDELELDAMRYRDQRMGKENIICSMRNLVSFIRIGGEGIGVEMIGVVQGQQLVRERDVFRFIEFGIHESKVFEKTRMWFDKIDLFRNLFKGFEMNIRKYSTILLVKEFEELVGEYGVLQSIGYWIKSEQKVLDSGSDDLNGGIVVVEVAVKGGRRLFCTFCVFWIASSMLIGWKEGSKSMEVGRGSVWDKPWERVCGNGLVLLGGRSFKEVNWRCLVRGWWRYCENKNGVKSDDRRKESIFWVEELALEAMNYGDQRMDRVKKLYRESHIDTLGYTNHSIDDVVDKIEVCLQWQTVEHVAGQALGWFVPC